MKAKDFKEIDQRIVDAIRQTLLKEQINPAVIERYLANAGEPVFAKSKDRSQTARLSQACDTVQIIASNKEDIDPVSIGMKVSQLLVGGSSGQQYFYPSEKMMDDLKQLGIEPMYKCHAFELVVRLDLNRTEAIRKLIVPANITFLQLHNILQAAFGWSNDHLYDFWLCERSEQEEPSIELVASDVDLEDRDGDIRLVDEIQLAELWQIRYLYWGKSYDFGDYWCHTIEVTREVHDYT
ncbi:MAG: plasmid pRiA4b family protein [Paenibacillaceae bacterium]|nr:plasmid pRiA4b family protein [Paenibacillaceae bacterium]